jgi:penicillin amidase
LPQYHGELALPVSQPVTVTRDSRGIPHIQASTLEDAWFTQGYVTAQERLFQMDALRRKAAGELSEVIGPRTLELDRAARTMLMRPTARRIAQRLDGQQLRAMAAYARGVNTFIESHRGRLPIEFTLLGYDPKPWRVEDSLLAGLQMFADLTTTWQDDLERQRLIDSGLDPQIVNLLLPERLGRDLQPGSNNWAVAGSRTVSGKPLLAGDMHLRHTLPATWFMASLKAEGVHVTGFTLPGLPGIIAGHNQHIAWAVTNLGFDVQDLYAERWNEARTAGQIGAQLYRVTTVRESIRVKGQKPVELEIQITPRGPVVADQPPVSIRWTALDPAAFDYIFLDLNAARDWTQFRAALSRFSGPGQNFAYADVQGNIGYQAAGRLPVRAGFCGNRVLNGADPRTDWQGFIPFDELPRSFNPPSGILVTANQDPFPVSYPYPVCGEFAGPYRFEQIRARLLASGKLDAAKITSIQMDVYTSYGKFLAGAAVAAYNKSKGRDLIRDEAAKVLTSWDGQMDFRQPAPALAIALHEEIADEVAKAAPTQTAALRRLIGTGARRGPVIQRLLTERPDILGQDWDALVARAFTAAVTRLEKRYGSRPAEWFYGQDSKIAINNLVLGSIPVIGQFFNIGPEPQSGHSWTVKQVSAVLGPSQRLVADLANWDQSLAVIPIGQSGHPLSPHYRDQWEDYYYGRQVRLPFNNVPAKAVLKIKPLR